VGMQPGRSASCFRLPETVFLRTDPDAERPVCIPTQSVTAVKLRGRHFKVPSGTAEFALFLPSLTGLDKIRHVRPGNELPGYYLPSLTGL
ncbi:MAG: hypothetical protein GY749_42070, partial [Desulfobacteraceae bacterium]|nr:hypothetical protein [Desulfobacteraceae bacterium]